MCRRIHAFLGPASILLLFFAQFSDSGCNTRKSQTMNAAAQVAAVGKDTGVLLRVAAQANSSHNIASQKQLLERVIGIQPPGHDNNFIHNFNNFLGVHNFSTIFSTILFRNNGCPQFVPLLLAETTSVHNFCNTRKLAFHLEPSDSSDGITQENTK